MVKYLLPVACLLLLSGCNPSEKMGQSMEKFTEKKTIRTQVNGDDKPAPPEDSGSDTDYEVGPDTDSGSDSDDNVLATPRQPPAPPPTPRGAGDSTN